MTLPKLSKVTIDGINVTSYIFKWEVPKVFSKSGTETGRITNASIWLNKNIKDVLTLTESASGVPVIIHRGVSSSTQYYVFRGFVEISQIEGPYIKLTCKDRLKEAVYSQVTYSYDKNVDTAQAGKISEIFKDLINNYTPLYADNNSVQDSGTAFTLDKFICNNESVYKKLEELAKVLDWQFYYKPSDDTVYFEPKGFVNSGITLTVGTNVIKVPKWVYNSTAMINSVKVYGSEVELETTESGKVGTTSGWTTSVAPLTYTPQSVKVYADAGDPPTTLLEGGITGVTSGTFHYTVDADEKEILWEDSAVSTDDFVEVRYSFKRQIPVIYKSNQSITDYRIEKAKKVVNDQLLTQGDTEEFARKYIQKYKDPFVYTKLRVIDVANLEAGQTVRIVDTINGEDRNLLANTITMRYPYNYDVVEVGDKIPRTSDWFANTMDRVENLENKNLRTDDILNHLEDFNPSVIYENRYLKAEHRDVTGNTVMIWGHATQGIWGTNVWGSDVDSAGVLHLERMIPGNNTYRELFYDNDLIDTTNSTVTLDNTNRRVTATNKQILFTNPIYYNNVAVRRINLAKTSAKSKGSITFVINTVKDPNGLLNMDIVEGYG